MNKFRQLWSNLRSSFWFMPSLIVVGLFKIMLFKNSGPKNKTDEKQGAHTIPEPARKKMF